MNILFITNTVSEYRICFFENLAEKSNITFLITHPEMALKIYGARGENNKFKSINLEGGLSKRRKSIQNEIDSGKYDKIVLPPADSINEAIESYTAMKAAKKRNIAYYTWTEKWEAPKKEQPIKKRIKNSIQRRIYKVLTKGTKKSVAYGTKSKEYLMSIGVPESRIGISHNTTIPPVAADQYDIKEKYALPKDKKIIFCMARLVERKGIDVLINSISILNKKHHDFILVIGGDGPLKDQLESQVRELELHNVYFLGHIQSNVKALYYRQADLFVISSKICDGVIEGWGLVVNEALFNGCPVVATDCVGAAYDMLDGNTGVMVKQNDSYALSVGIEQMLYREDRDVIRQAIDNINEKYSVDVMGDGLLECLK